MWGFAILLVSLVVSSVVLLFWAAGRIRDQSDLYHVTEPLGLIKGTVKAIGCSFIACFIFFSLSGTVTPQRIVSVADPAISDYIMPEDKIMQVTASDSHGDWIELEPGATLAIPENADRASLRVVRAGTLLYIRIDDSQALSAIRDGIASVEEPVTFLPHIALAFKRAITHSILLPFWNSESYARILNHEPIATPLSFWLGMYLLMLPAAVVAALVILLLINVVIRVVPSRSVQRVGSYLAYRQEKKTAIAAGAYYCACLLAALLLTTGISRFVLEKPDCSDYCPPYRVVTVDSERLGIGAAEEVEHE